MKKFIIIMMLLVSFLTLNDLLKDHFVQETYISTDGGVTTNGDEEGGW